MRSPWSGLSPFPKSGVWVVRAVLDTTAGSSYSPLSEITVASALKERPARDEDGAGDHFVRLALSGGGIGKQHFERVRELEKLYPDTYRAAVLRRALLVAEYRAATTVAERNRAAEAVKDHCKDMPAHIRDMMYLYLAEAMADAKEYVEAAAILDKIETAYDVSELRTRIVKQK